METTKPNLVSKGWDSSRVHYQQFYNIFLYITERCQLRCGHCYMGDRLERRLNIPYDKAERILSSCRKLGARYVTFLGGEPTLHPDLPRMVDSAIDLGFEQVMIDTNGLLPERICTIDPKKLHYISVSLDGASQSTHERVRGKGTFDKTVRCIDFLVSNAYSVRVNCTVFQFNVHEAESLLSLADRLGVHLVNFHTFSAEGYGASNPDWSLSPIDWISFYQRLGAIGRKFKVAIWYPPTWAAKDKVSAYAKEGFRGCLGCSLDRLSIFPDGRCYVCSVLFDHPVHFGTLVGDKLLINREQNEFNLFSEAMVRAPAASLCGCPAEEKLAGADQRPDQTSLISMCRCWKSRV